MPGYGSIARETLAGIGNMLRLWRLGNFGFLGAKGAGAEPLPGGGGIMARIASAEEATRLAMDFVTKHRPFVTPLKAYREDDIWTVEVDVGIFQRLVGKVRINATTGEILDYDLP